MSDRLAGCDPLLIEKVRRVLADMADLGHPMIATDGFRTEAQQALKWMQGRVFQVGAWHVVGPVVTYCDGVIKKSNHQSGRAADCAFLIDGKPSWDEHLPWKLYADTAISEGLQAGYYWRGKTQDKPHIELPADQPGTLDA